MYQVKDFTAQEGYKDLLGYANTHDIEVVNIETIITGGLVEPMEIIYRLWFKSK